MLHTLDHCSDDIILNLEIFTDIHPGEYIRVKDSSASSKNSVGDNNSVPVSSGYVFRVPLEPAPQKTTSGRLEISINKSIAETMNFKTYARVTIEKILDPSEVEIDFVELVFKRQFLNRGHMWFIKQMLVLRSVCMHQNLTLDGIQLTIHELYVRGLPALTGVISDKTNIIFRSRSCRFVWLVQLSAEMWEFDQKGDLYFEKFLYKFVDPLIERWKEMSTTHCLTVIFFARNMVVESHKDSDGSLKSQEVFSSSSSVKRRNDGQLYQDYFKVAVDNYHEQDKSTMMRDLKREFWNFAKLVGWSSNSTLEQDEAHVSTQSLSSTSCYPSLAIDGNFLEAINTTLNLLDKHYIDRDLNRTGNSIVMISAGTGIFKVNPRLAQITKQRMLDNATGMDFISLSQPPLHVAPLFLIDCSDEGNESDFYEVPHWINISFVDFESNEVEISRGADDVKKNFEKNGGDESYKSLTSFTTSSIKQVYRYHFMIIHTMEITNVIFLSINMHSQAPNLWIDSFKPFPFVDILNSYFRLHFRQNPDNDNYDFCLPSSLKHALNAQNSLELGSYVPRKHKEVKIGTWGEILNMNNDFNESESHQSRKGVAPGRLLRDGKLPLLPSIQVSDRKLLRSREKTTSSIVTSDKDTVASLSANSSAGLLISGSLGKSDLQVGSFESRDENSSNNSESVSIFEDGRVAPLSGSVKSFGSGSDETLKVRHSQSAGVKAHSPSFLGNAIDLISIGKAKMVDYVKIRHSTDQGPRSLTDEGNGMYGLGLDINVESPDLVAPSFMKRLAAQEVQRKQTDHINRMKAWLLGSMQKYDEEASIVTGRKMPAPLVLPTPSSSSSSFQSLKRRDSEGDKDKYRLHSFQSSPRAAGREQTPVNREKILEEHPRRERSDSNPIRIIKNTVPEPMFKTKKTILRYRS